MAGRTTASDGVANVAGQSTEIVRSALAWVWTLLRWGLVILVGVLWLAFWVTLARHHLSMGDATAAAISVVPIVVPPVLLLLQRWRR